MKLLFILFFSLFVSLASAQDSKNVIEANVSLETKIVSDNFSNSLVICVKGVKKIEEIDVENYNMSTYIKMIATQKRKQNIS